MNVLESKRAAALQHASMRAAHLTRRAEDARQPRPATELHAIAQRSTSELRDASADEVIAWATNEFGPLMAVACSMADAALPHLVSRHNPWVDVLFLDTGYHFAETVGTRQAVEASMRVNVVDVRPQLSVAEQDERYGRELYSQDPTACCAMRKIAPLAAALNGYEAWVTGVRREESPTRAGTPLIDWDDRNRLVKINPLAAWTMNDLLAYAATNDVIVNPLMHDGFPSIGCAPCTDRVAPGADPRSGRWAGIDKVECGLHG